MQIEQRKLIAKERREQEVNFRSTGNTLEVPALKQQAREEGYEVRGTWHQQGYDPDGAHADSTVGDEPRYDMLVQSAASRSGLSNSVNPPWWVEEDSTAQTPFHGTKRATENAALMSAPSSFAPTRTVKKRAEWFD